MDTVLTEVKAEDLVKVGGCKALGAWYLHQHTKALPAVHTFCVISSVASLMGGRGRSAYSAANAFMDALIRQRHALGLPGTAFNMTSLCVRALTVCLFFFIAHGTHWRLLSNPPSLHHTITPTARTWASWPTT